MGVAYSGYCYPDADSASIALMSEYRHEHNPAYTRIIPSIQDGNVIINHYKVQGGSLILDTAIPSYQLPTCSQTGSLQTPDSFNPSNLNPIEVVNAIGYGFIILALPLSVAWAGRRFVKAIFHK